MSDREAFENWLHAEDSPVNPDGLTTEVINVMRIAYEAALEHCKQGEPVCYADPENVDMTSHKDIRFRFNVCTKNENQFTQPLFAHAIPKSELVKALESYYDRLYVHKDIATAASEMSDIFALITKHTVKA